MREPSVSSVSKFQKDIPLPEVPKKFPRGAEPFMPNPAVLALL